MSWRIRLARGRGLDFAMIGGIAFSRGRCSARRLLGYSAVGPLIGRVPPGGIKGFGRLGLRIFGIWPLLAMSP